MRDRGNKRFCSALCKNRYYDQRRDEATRFRDLICKQCNGSFRGRPTRQFCSRNCAATYRWLHEPTLTHPSGTAHPSWKGGRNAARRRKTYKLEPEDYEAMLAAQNGVCAICEQVRGSRPLGVDHDHETGAIRGLLCGKCNAGLGLFNDDLALLHAGARYLAAAAADRDARLTASG